eukprot:5419895-Pyramimonas_sp.AAC.1
MLDGPHLDWSETVMDGCAFQAIVRGRGTDTVDRMGRWCSAAGRRSFQMPKPRPGWRGCRRC